jgi:hypothetical protein
MGPRYYQTDCADRERYPEHDGQDCRNDKFYGDHFVGHRGSRFDLPRALDATFRWVGETENL